MTKFFKCSFCNGMGKDPFDLLSPNSDCLVCHGEKIVVVQEPVRKCVFWSGSGKNPLGARVTCIVCGGKGFNHCDSNKKCTQCMGTGKSSDGLPCTGCKGFGFK